MNGVGMIDYGTGGAPVLMARNLAAAKKSWNWNFAKTKRGASGGFLPRPLLLRLRNPKSAEVLRKPYPQKNDSAKPSPHC